MTPCYIFDIDGTVADLSHRLHYIQKTPKDWDAFFDACRADEPIPHICDLVRILAGKGHYIVYVSGRSVKCKDHTIDWLDAHSLGSDALYMRQEGDHRSDHIVKAELLDTLIADGWQPIMAFEDRKQVVDMWRERGVPCAQVAPGDF